MSQNHCTTKVVHYTHLSEIERGQIQVGELKFQVQWKIINKTHRNTSYNVRC